MKLAREIAQEHYAGKEDLPELQKLFDDAEAKLEVLIASKLEPVREAIVKLAALNSPKDCECSVCVRTNEIIALLSEEEQP